VFLNLVVAELENLEAIREGSLSRPSFRKVVYYLLVWECLLDVIIVKVDYRVA
jgi:hypothetical protein